MKRNQFFTNLCLPYNKGMQGSINNSRTSNFKTMKHALRLVFVFLIAIFTGLQSANASHLAAGNISYTYIGPNQYLLTLTLYRDCSGISAPTTVSISYNAPGCAATSLSITLQPIPGTGAQVANSPCVPGGSCTGSPAQGMQEWKYQGTVTLPQACSNWTFSYSLCCRNTSTNITNSQSQNFFVSSTLNNQAFPTNSSPTFNFPPYQAFCVNSQFFFDQGATDIDGDSMVFTLAGGQSAAGTQMGYVNPYTPLCPLQTTPACAISIDPNTGLISFLPTLTGSFVIVVRVDQYDKVTGLLIGSVTRDMQILISANCNIIYPAYDPTIATGGIIASCGDTSIIVDLQNDIQCGSVAPDGSDFRLTGPTSNPLPVISATPLTCINGFTRQIRLNLWLPLTNGTHYLQTKVGFDNNTLLSICGTSMAEYDTVLVVANTVGTVQPATETISCNAVAMMVTFPDEILCTSISLNGSDFNLVDGSGNSYIITAMAGVGCATGSLYTNQIYMTLGSYIGNAGTLYLIAKNGTDANTIANRCGNFNPIGDTMATIQATAPLSISVGSDLTICSADALPTIDAGISDPNATFTWTLDGNPVGGNTQVLQTTGPGVYAVNVSLGPFCQGDDDMTLTVIQTPVVNIGGDIVHCASDPLPTLDAGNSGATTYVWTLNGTPFGGNTQTVTAPATSGTIAVSVTNGGICTSTDTLDFIVTNNPIITMADQTICAGQNATLDAGIANATSYAWTYNGNPAGNTQTITATQAGTYNVNVTIGSNCNGSGNMTLSVITIPVINLASSTICDGDPIALLDAGNPGAVSYIWSLDGNVIPGANGQTYQPTVAGAYSVIVDNGNGCTGSGSMTLTVLTNLIIDLGGDQTICEGLETTIDAGPVAGGGTYSWTLNGNPFGGNTQTIQVSQSGTYVVNVVNSNGCTGTDEADLFVQAYPPATTVNCVSSNGNYTYSWASIPGAAGYEVSIDGGVTWINPSSGATGVTHTISSPVSNFQVHVIGSGDCNPGPAASATCEVIIPNVMTIDGDGKNDIFAITNLSQFNNVVLEVYNRWGIKVYENSAYENFNKWDGDKLSAGTYFYNLIINDTDKRTGTLTIIRK